MKSLLLFVYEAFSLSTVTNEVIVCKF